jgi:photosystem II stability/assembly factor-like uncharacterized protein
MASSHVYVGLAGDTDPGRFVSSGLFRSAEGTGPWESIGERVHRAPEVRAILTDPTRPGRVTVGTQRGVFRSDDRGERWRQLDAPEPGLAVWSLAAHPRDPDTLLAGYEPCAIVRSTDDGRSWERLPVEVAFPAVTLGPDMPKRVTGIAVDPGDPEAIYASVEIGGLLRSLDGGRSWACMTDGLYVVEDGVDLHAVAVHPARPGTVTVAGRIGTFRSEDRGLRWRSLGVPPLRPKGSYCRTLAAPREDPSTLYLGAGNDFDGDKGALFVTRDEGRSWRALDLGGPLKSTIFALALDPARPGHVCCATKYGGVFRSEDGGESWRPDPMPPGVGHVFVLAVGD